MARYFKYKSTEELAAENVRLGLDLRFSDDFAPLFQTVRIGPLTAGNALCIQPMEGCDGTLDGQPGELTLRRYRRFGAGGAKLIWFEAAAVVPEGRANTRQLLINESNLPAIAECLSECRKAHRAEFGSDDDLVIGLQLTHSGRLSQPKPMLATRDELLDPRTIMDKATGRTAGPDDPLLSDEYLQGLVDAYARAAELAQRIGFQFIDVKQCHRYLLSEMLAACSRPGRYGGSLENRTRLAREIFTAIKAAAPRLVLATRMNLFDGIPYIKDPVTGVGVPTPCPPSFQEAWGTNLASPTEPDLTEPIAWIQSMTEFGVGLINMSMGNAYAAPHLLRPFEYPPPDGYETPEHPLCGVNRHFRLTAAIQERFPELPVVGSGYSYLQEFLMHAAAANVRDHRCTFAGVGRATLAQPDFVKQIQDHGRLDRKRVCRTFSYCTALMRSKDNELGQFAAGCPPFDKEGYGAIWQEAELKVRKEHG